MPLSQKEQNLFFAHKHIPFVGLIHKTTKEIILAPCIPEKVELNLNEAGKATSGNFLDDNLSTTSKINKAKLCTINRLLTQNYVPRIAYTHDAPFDRTSSHQFLFQQKAGATNMEEWGGFAIRLNKSKQIEYTFASGAFNSEAGKRTKGACLSQALIDNVIEETAMLGPQAPIIEENKENIIHQDPFSTPPLPPAPSQKRQCSQDLRINSAGLFGAPLDLTHKDDDEENENDLNNPSAP